MFDAITRLFRKEDKPRQKICLQCGRCCEAFGGHLNASPHDIRRWQELGRTDLIAHTNRLGWIWVDPETKALLPRCPFLKEVDEDRCICSIYDVRPLICRAYPTLAHGKRCLRGGFFSVCPTILVSLPVYASAFDAIPFAA